jgi:hypothetical protein
MSSTTSTILGLVAVVAIGGFICYALFPSRRTPSTPGTAEDTNLIRQAGAPGVGHAGTPSGMDGSGSSI